MWPLNSISFWQIKNHEKMKINVLSQRKTMGVVILSRDLLPILVRSCDFLFLLVIDRCTCLFQETILLYYE